MTLRPWQGEGLSIPGGTNEPQNAPNPWIPAFAGMTGVSGNDG